MSTSSINLTNSVLDVASIVDNLIYVDSAPVRSMQSKVTSLQSKVTAYQTLNTKLSALSDDLNTILFGDTEAPGTALSFCRQALRQLVHQVRRDLIGSGHYFRHSVERHGRRDLFSNGQQSGPG